MHADTYSVIKQRVIHGFLFLLLTITGGNALANELPAATLPLENLRDTVVVECLDEFLASTSGSPIPRFPIPDPPPPDPFQVVLGCRLTNCGLPAPAHSPIELRISVKSDLVASTVLGIENMSAADAAGIEIIQGNVDRRDPLQWTIGPGVTRLRGFSVSHEMRPPVITFRPLPNEARVLALTNTLREIQDLGSQNIGKIEIDVAQWHDTFVVSQKRIVELRFCGAKPGHPQDQITLQNHPGTPNPTVLLNGRRSINGCIDSTRLAAVETHTGNSSIFLENMLPNDTCYSEASIFLKDRAMRLKVIDSTAPTWTGAPTDIVPVDMQQPPIQVPVHLWVLWPDDTAPTAQQGTEDTVAAARTDLEEANTLYGNTQSGIQFFMPSGSPQVRIDSRFWRATCDHVAGLALVGYATDQLNVYYVGYPPSTELEQAHGWHCVTDNANVIIIRAAVKMRATLAHELGHALSLQWHADTLTGLKDENSLPVFDPYNIMWGTFANCCVDPRTKLTKGQSFRTNVSEGSALYRMILLGGGTLDTAVPSPGRSDCTEGHTSAQCPWIGAD